MRGIQSPHLCLGIPIDHRLEPLLPVKLTAPNPFESTGDHMRTIEDYGKGLQLYREDITDYEVNFAKWLAKPETKGGVVIALLQPAEHQRYFEDHNRTVGDSDTLSAVDEVCRTVTGYGIEHVSCFDAFPFQKTPLGKKLEADREGNIDDIDDDDEIDLDMAYDVFLEMMEQKQPQVVFCCYRSPRRSKYTWFECVGIGRTRVNSAEKSPIRVNGFHPGYALNYLGGKSALRTLFILETAKAFHRARGTWPGEAPWMNHIRQHCQELVKRYTQYLQDQPGRTKYDFQLHHFETSVRNIEGVLHTLNPEKKSEMTEMDLLNLILSKNCNLTFSNCLLTLIKIVDFEYHGARRLEEKGLTWRRQNEERDLRDLRTKVEQTCTEFLNKLQADKSTLQLEESATGMFTTAGLDRKLAFLEPQAQHIGLQRDIRLTYRKFAYAVNNACRHDGSEGYTFELKELANAFQLAAKCLEWALGQHSNRNVPRVSKGDYRTPKRPISETNENESMPGSGRSPITPMQESGQTSSLPTPPYTPSRRTTQRLHASFSMPPPPPPQPDFGVRTPATSSLETSEKPACTEKECAQEGHFWTECPQIRCRQCNKLGHIARDCPPTPQS